MLNIYFNDEDQTKIRMYRTAYLKDDTGNKLSFRYALLEREDITKIEVLKSVDMEERTITIRTTSNLPFRTQNKILIDKKLYNVQSIYKENQKMSNGMFRNNVQPFTYLILKN